MAEHLARRYPQGGLSPKATAIGMQSLAEAYNTYTEIDRRADLDRLVRLATYTAETWPDREEGDDARLNLGQISLRPGPVRSGDRGVRGGPAPLQQVVRGADRGSAPPTGPRAVCSSAGKPQRRRGRGPEGASRCSRPPSRHGVKPGPDRPTPASSAMSATWPSCSPRRGRRPKPSSSSPRSSRRRAPSPGPPTPG